MTEEKVCPLILLWGGSIFKPGDGEEIAKKLNEMKFCIKEKCQWWTGAYTIEGGIEYDCAIVIFAIKNAEGYIPT